MSSGLKERAEGVRIRHTLNGNSLKMYDKEGSVLRVETTIVRPREFKIYRAREGQPEGQKRWRILRKGNCNIIDAAKCVEPPTNVTLKPWQVSPVQALLCKKQPKPVAPLSAMGNVIVDSTLWRRRITPYSWR